MLLNTVLVKGSMQALHLKVRLASPVCLQTQEHVYRFQICFVRGSGVPLLRPDVHLSLLRPPQIQVHGLQADAPSMLSEAQAYLLGHTNVIMFPDTKQALALKSVSSVAAAMDSAEVN